MVRSPVIRTIQPQEWRQYREVRLKALKDSPDAFASTYEEAVVFPDSRWIERLERVSPETDHPVTAIEDGQMVGLAWGMIDSQDPHCAYLFQMWVDPGYRGRGIGCALLESVIAWARNVQANRIKLDVTCGDRPARRLYERLGFQVVGVPQRLRDGSGLFEDAMELFL